MVDVRQLETGELAWIDELADGVRDNGVAPRAEDLSRYFDEQRAAWFAIPEEQRDDPDLIIDGIGAAVGNIFVVELGLAWVAATDEHGTEAAVYGDPCEVLLFPMNAVAKRWTGESGGSLSDFIAWTLSEVRDIRRRADHDHEKRTGILWFRRRRKP